VGGKLSYIAFTEDYLGALRLDEEGGAVSSSWPQVFFITEGFFH
jgi:hypothetical protein